MGTAADWMRGLLSAAALGSALACTSGGGDHGDEAGGGGTVGSDGSAGTGASAGTGGGAGSGEPVASGPLFGHFDVELIAATPAGVVAKARAARTDVSGRLRDGVQPEMQGWEMLDEIGDCALFAPNTPSCSPACTLGVEQCAPGDVCERIPLKQSAGAVTVEGLGAPFEIVDKVVGNYELPNGLNLPYPPCDEGDPITLRAEGGAEGPFELRAPCVGTLDLPEGVPLAQGMPVELRWPAPAMPELTTLHVHLDIAHHGGARGQIECDTDDDGELDIDAALVDGLIGLGVAGFPTVVLTRTAVAEGTDAASAHVSLVVTSSYERAVLIEGLLSCTDSAECPQGQSCGLDFVCRTS